MPASNRNEITIVKRSVPLLGLKLVILELIAELLYLLIRSALEYVQQFAGLQLPYVGPIVQAVILVLQLGIVLYLFASWANEFYELRQNEVVVRTGILNKQERSYPYNNMQSVIVREGILSRTFNAGSVAVYIPTLGQELQFTDVSNPKHFAELLKQALPFTTKGQFIMRNK